MSMSIKKILKITGIILLLLVVVAGTLAYLKLREAGIIPRNDYETIAPQLPEMSHPSVLILNKTNGFIHKEGIPAADAMLKRIAKNNGWDVFVTNNAASHEKDILQKFDLVVWNNVSGDVLTAGQRESLKNWLRDGGGWIGLHAAGGDFSYKWQWYVDTLIGVQFKGHTLDPQFQTAELHVSNAQAGITSHINSPWRIENEEWYAFESNPRDKGYEILLTLDESTYVTGGKDWRGMDDRMEGEHPIAWRQNRGSGKVFYSAIGHQPDTYSIPEYELFIAKAMQWALDTSE
jgi:type 1 glutamine amidotransferase